MKGPLWLPPGSVRDLVTLILVVGFTWGFIIDRIPSDQFALATLGVLGINGVMRQADKARGEPSDQGGDVAPRERGKG